jgi:hypothetical protein
MSFKEIVARWIVCHTKQLADIEHHMLHFLTIMMSSDWQVQQERHKREAVNGGIYNY